MKANVRLCLAVLLGSLAATVGEPASSTGSESPAPKEQKELSLDLGNDVTMRLILIPAGKFMMGSPKDEPDRSVNEGPQREVTISKPFYMGLFEVTQEQYQQVAGWNPSRFKGGQNPVEIASWKQADDFCEQLAKKTGKRVFLPTEAQWEYACRAGTTTRFSFGDDDKDLGKHAWHKKNSETRPHPVGRKEPNAWGLHDMHGNVYEWCADWYADSYVPAGRPAQEAERVDPTGPASGENRVLRGGCWRSAAQGCRSAFRAWAAPEGRNYSIIGFRVAVEADAAAGGAETGPPATSGPAGPLEPTTEPSR